MELQGKGRRAKRKRRRGEDLEKERFEGFISIWRSCRRGAGALDRIVTVTVTVFSHCLLQPPAFPSCSALALTNTLGAL